MFDRKKYDDALGVVFVAYEKTAPTVCEWCDLLASAKDDAVTLADVHLLDRLATELPHPNLAANLVYHVMDRRGMNTTGHAGF